MWLVVLAVVVSLQVPAAPTQLRADSRTWYQAYSDGVRAFQKGDWQAAVDSLEAAKRAGAPKPGRKIPFYGDVYNDFIPDYYLGIAYVNLKKYAEADRAFEAVRASALVGPKDREYQQFEAQARVAKSQLVLAQAAPAGAVQAAPSGNAPVNAPNAAVPTVSKPAPYQPAAVAQQNPPVTNLPAPTPVGPPTVGTAIRGRPGLNNAVLKPGNISPNRPNQGVVSRFITPADEQAAVSAYLSGQYDQAATLLAGAASGSAATPRAYFYLACSRTALAILGQADAAAVTSARALLARAGDPAQFAADRRYVSPRVLQMLGVAP
jgi:hypothetical protein